MAKDNRQYISDIRNISDPGALFTEAIQMTVEQLESEGGCTEMIKGIHEFLNSLAETTRSPFSFGCWRKTRSKIGLLRTRF